jgi:hypothetical protein
MAVISTHSQSQPLPPDSASSKEVISPLFRGSGCIRPDTAASTTCPASLLVVHVAASPALVRGDKSGQSDSRGGYSATAPESPDPDRTSAAPAPVSAAATAAAIEA